MIDQLGHAHRALLISAKSTAILGNPELAINLLSSGLKSANKIEKLAMLLGKAEIYHWDFRDDLALDIFKEIDKVTGEFPESVEVSVAYNRSDITFALFQVDDFYGVVDRRKVSGIAIWNSDAYDDISNARESNKRNESLARSWQELRRTYLQGCWRPYRTAAKLFARECMELGWPQEAIYHAVISGNKDTAENIGKTLMLHASNEILVAACRKWLDCTSLRRMFVTGCGILKQFADVIPDCCFGDIFERLTGFASLPVVTRQDESVSSEAWQTIAAISNRLDKDQAERLWDVAVNHTKWNSTIPEGNRVLTGRDEIMKAIGKCIPSLPIESLKVRIEQALSLVIDRKQNTDYPDAINLICHLCHHAEDDAKTIVKDKLYPSGKPLDAYLLQVTDSFGVELSKPESLNEGAEKLAAKILEQVRRLPLSEEVCQSAGTFGFYTVEKNDHKLIVNMADSVLETAILRHRSKISEHSLGILIDAMLKMISEPENLISNKVGLVQAMTSIGDACSSAQAQDIFEAIAPLAKGDIVEPISIMSSSEAENPMNPYKIKTGSPHDLQAVSVMLLCCLERDQPGIGGQELSNIIEVALVHHHATVRSLAISGTHEKPNLSEAEFTAIILATRDSDPGVVNAAFGALANKTELKLTRPQWRLLIHSADIATRANDAKIRRGAAYACSKLVSRCTTKSLQNQIKQLIKNFQADRCFSVRKLV